MPIPSRKFKDLNLDMSVHPNTKDLVFKKDSEAVKAALLNIMLTNEEERPFNPDFGVGIRHILFEPLSYFAAISLQETIYSAIKAYEPRVLLEYLLVQPNEEENGYNIKIVFTMNNVLNPIVIDYFLERTR